MIIVTLLQSDMLPWRQFKMEATLFIHCSLDHGKPSIGAIACRTISPPPMKWHIDNMCVFSSSGYTMDMPHTVVLEL